MQQAVEDVDLAPDRGTDPRPWPKPRDRYIVFGEMLLFATLSLIASFVLSYDAIILARNPDAILTRIRNVVELQ